MLVYQRVIVLFYPWSHAGAEHGGCEHSQGWRSASALREGAEAVPGEVSMTLGWQGSWLFTLWSTNRAIENGSFIVELPWITHRDGDFPVRKLLVYQRLMAMAYGYWKFFFNFYFISGITIG